MDFKNICSKSVTLQCASRKQKIRKWKNYIKQGFHFLGDFKVLYHSYFWTANSVGWKLGTLEVGTRANYQSSGWKIKHFPTLNWELLFDCEKLVSAILQMKVKGWWWALPISLSEFRHFLIEFSVRWSVWRQSCIARRFRLQHTPNYGKNSFHI